MRELTFEELGAVAGAQDDINIHFGVPSGWEVSATLEANNSTTFNFSFNGNSLGSWNSGVGLACHFISTAGVMIFTAVSKNPTLARSSVVSFMAGLGCSELATCGTDIYY